MGYRYTYILMALIFFAVWLALYILRKDNRREMIVMSLIFGFIGPFADILYTKDWWQSLTPG